MDSETKDALKPIPLIKRKRLTAEQRQQILKRFEEGVLTLKDFVTREGISKSTLVNWLREARESSTTIAPSISFQELKLPQCGGSWAVEIVTPQNWTVRLAQSPEAATLRQVLGALPC